MKAILLLDTDEIRPDCAGCMAHYITTWGEEHPHRCEAVQRRLPDDCEEKKPEWCPLKEIPERKDTISQINLEKEAKINHVKVDAQAGFNLGWNACLNEICEKEE